MILLLTLETLHKEINLKLLLWMKPSHRRDASQYEDRLLYYEIMRSSSTRSILIKTRGFFFSFYSKNNLLFSLSFLVLYILTYIHCTFCYDFANCLKEAINSHLLETNSQVNIFTVTKI